ncbi:pim proto-oncogene, serine/threonine kinase, related 128 isoform 2-T6 [Menidia menidia]
MVKCFVSACPNRVGAHGPPRRFFRFPRDPDRVRVWLAALRQTGADQVSVDQVSVDQVCGDQVCGDQVSGDQVSVDQGSGDQVCGDQVSGDQVCGDQVSEDQVSEDQVSEDQVCGDQVSEDQVCVDQVSVDQVSVDHVSGDQVSEDQVSVDQVCGDQVSVDQVSEDQVSEDQVCGDQVSEDQVSEDQVCGDQVCVDQVCVDQVCGDQVSVDQVSVDQVCGDQVSEDQVSEDQVSGDQVCGDQVSVDHFLVCEDHFLPEDMSTKGLVSGAIPLTPPCPGGGVAYGVWGGGAWGGGDQTWVQMDPAGGPRAAEEEEEEEEEEGGAEEEEEETAEQPPPENPLEMDLNSVGARRVLRSGTPLSMLTRGFLDLLTASPDGSLDLQQAAWSLQTSTRRVRRILAVLGGLGLVQRFSNGRITWTGRSPACSFLWRSPVRFLSALERLKLVELQLDGIIRTCSQQLLQLTDDPQSAKAAYVSCEDVSRLAGFQEQTLILIKAPRDTTLQIPEPGESGVEMNLVAGNSPIMALTCEVAPPATSTSDPQQGGAVFSQLETSRIVLHRRSPDSGSSAPPRTRGGPEGAGPRAMGPRCQSASCLRSSKHQCGSISEDSRRRAFGAFWGQRGPDQRRDYVRGLVEVLPVRRRRGRGFAKREHSLVFHLGVDGQRRRVCRNMFLATLGIRGTRVLRWVRDG